MSAAMPIGCDRSLLEKHLRAERMRVLTSSSKATLLPAILLACIAVSVLWNVTQTGVLLAWFGLLTAAYGSRYWFVHSYATETTPEIRTYERFAVLSAAATGTAWGLIALLPLPRHALEYEVFFGFVISGVTAMATPSLGTYRRAACAFIVPCVLPLTARMLWHAAAVELAMSGMLVLYLLVLYATVVRIGAGMEHAVRARLEADLRGDALHRSSEELQHQQRVIAAIAHVQAAFIRGEQPSQIFASALERLLELSGARAAFIAEILGEPSTQRCFVRIAVRSSPHPAYGEGPQIPLTAQLRAMLEQASQEDAAFTVQCRLADALGVPTTNGENATYWPLRVRDRLIGMIGVTYRTHAPSNPALLDSFATTVSQLMLAMQAERQRRSAQEQLDRTRAQLAACLIDTPAAGAELPSPRPGQRTRRE